MTTATAPRRQLLLIWPSEPASTTLLDFAAEMAQRWDAELHILAALEPPADLPLLRRFTGLGQDEIVARLIADTRADVDACVARSALREPPEFHVRVGKRFIEIVHFAIDHATTLILKTAEQPVGVLTRPNIASTDQHLLRKCPCPVWLIPAAGAPENDGVVAAVDVGGEGSPEPETLASLNRLILETAARIASGGVNEVVVVHAWEAPGESIVRGWCNAGDPDQLVREYLHEAREGHQQALDRLLDPLRSWAARELGTPVRFLGRLERGAAAEVIPERVTTLGAGVLVMGTVSRVGIPGFLIGNTAEDVLNRVPASVVAVRPPSFVSPLDPGK